MLTGWRAFGEVAHWASLVPLLVCVVVWMRSHYSEHIPEPNAWLLAGAFAVSFVADQVGARLQAHHMNNWWVIHVYAPLQFSLFLVIVTRRFPVQVLGVFLLVLIGVLSILRGPLTEPETMVHVIGGLLVAWLVYDSQPMRRYRSAVMVYGLGTAPCLLALAVLDWSSVWWWPTWGAYQAVRLVALGLMVRALWTAPTLRLEVSNGPRTREAAVGHRPPLRVAGSDNRHAMAAENS